MGKISNTDEYITLIVIGIAIGIAIGFVLKVYIDTYILIEGLPLWKHY